MVSYNIFLSSLWKCSDVSVVLYNDDALTPTMILPWSSIKKEKIIDFPQPVGIKHSNNMSATINCLLTLNLLGLNINIGVTAAKSELKTTDIACQL